MRTTSILSTLALAFALTGCRKHDVESTDDTTKYLTSLPVSTNQAENTKLYLVGAIMADCIGVTPSDYDLRRVDLTWADTKDSIYLGLFYKNLALISKRSEGNECQTANVVAHELQHAKQLKEGWVWSTTNTPYSERVEEVDAYAQQARCMLEYTAKVGYDPCAGTTWSTRPIKEVL
jgi:hypothetical protein